MLAFACAAAALLLGSTLAQPSPDYAACQSLKQTCNKNSTDLNNYYNNTACVAFSVCSLGWGQKPSTSLSEVGAPASQPRLTQSAFYALSNGSETISQEGWVNAYYYELSKQPNATYPDDPAVAQNNWALIEAWTGFCNTTAVPYKNLADYFEYSEVAGVCGATASCDPNYVDTNPCVRQPASDNGSCQEVANQCRLWVTRGIFQNEYCVLASFCYAWASTDVLIRKEYPSYAPTIPSSKNSTRLSQEVFNNMTGGASTMSQQNAIDRYYNALTGTYTSLGGPFGGETPSKTNNNGPYPTDSSYVKDFWSVIAAWTGFCSTKQIPYKNLADYLQYAATSNYHPSC